MAVRESVSHVKTATAPALAIVLVSCYVRSHRRFGGGV